MMQGGVTVVYEKASKLCCHHHLSLIIRLTKRNHTIDKLVNVFKKHSVDVVSVISLHS